MLERSCARKSTEPSLDQTGARGVAVGPKSLAESQRRCSAAGVGKKRDTVDGFWLINSWERHMSPTRDLALLQLRLFLSRSHATAHTNARLPARFRIDILDPKEYT